MGVYNPKATMPRSCFDCGCNDGFTCEYLETDCYIADYAQTERIHPDCPLVEVKEPHGRLIDADAIGYAGIEKAAYDSLLIVKEQNKLCEDLELLERANGRLDGVLRITSKLRFAPTVIPAEEG